MTDYGIRPLSLRCACTGRDQKPGEPYYSVLSDSPAGFVRADYCAEAWTGPPEGAIGFWRSQVPSESSTKRQAFVADSVIMEFFVRLAGELDDHRKSFRYILSLLLLRRRVLKLVGGVRECDAEVLILRVISTGEEHRVVDPHLSEEQLNAVQAEVERLLQVPNG